MTVEELPLVTVLIPARNEAADIVGCITSIGRQDYPLDRIEVVVVDGASTDDTAGRARQSLAALPLAHTAVLHNPDATTPSNLNVGLRYASGRFLCRVDARTRIEPHYVRTCARLLAERPDVAVVGGAQCAVARDRSARAIGIARALNNRYSMGGSRYRRSTTSGPGDTVYLGAFRRADLLDERGWDERLTTNQDFELNRRMARRGMVWFDASLQSAYVPRGTLGDLWRQYVRFGHAKVAYWRMCDDRPRPRQRALLGLPVVGLLLVAGAASRGHLGTALVAGSSGLVGLEVVGEQHLRGGLRVHLVSAAAMLCVGAGWTTGAWRELLRR